MRLPACGFTFKGKTCLEVDGHFCPPRAARAVGFFSTCLVHTKGQFARKPFVLAGWQRHDIIEPLFGEVLWSEEGQRYRRRYTRAWIELARKNGKSELDAGIALLLMCADDEESAEIYGMALDVPQAKKVFEVAVRMTQLSRVLSKRLVVKESARRIIDPKTGSYYEVVPADAAGNLGHNPHGAVLDEALTQRDGSLWEAITSAEGTRVQPLYVATTTAGNDPTSWAAKESEEARRVAEDPQRAPHYFVFARNVPKDADPWDEKNWHLSNPALGDFLSVESLRRAAVEARNDPAKENAFRQFRLNQWVQQVTRWMPLRLWDESAGLVVESELRGKRCFGGLDLASTTDLASLCWVFPGNPAVALWRFWTPEAQVPFLDSHTGGRASVWVRQGLLTATPGDFVDPEAIHHQIDKDLQNFDVVDIGHDRWGSTGTVQWLQSHNVDTYPLAQGFGLSPALKEIMRLIKAREINTGGNPVARWNADSAEVKQDPNENIRLVKPERNKSGKRVDGMAALAMAVDGLMRRGVEETPSELFFFN
jgi:phage terminase large subunit-like protein